MIVKEIAEVKFKQGGSGWKTSFEETEKVLWTKTKPDFVEGADIPEDELEVNQKGNYQLKGSKPKSAPPRYTKNDTDIMLQVCLKAAVELETHHIVPEGKINTGRVIQAVSELFADMMIMRPKDKA